MVHHMMVAWILQLGIIRIRGIYNAFPKHAKSVGMCEYVHKCFNYM